MQTQVLEHLTSATAALSQMGCPVPHQRLRKASLLFQLRVLSGKTRFEIRLIQLIYTINFRYILWMLVFLQTDKTRSLTNLASDSGKVKNLEKEVCRQQFVKHE